MNMEWMMQYLTYAFMAVGVMAFIVAAIVQVIKELPGLQKIPTNAVALAVSAALCPAAVVTACQYLGLAVRWYDIFASLIAAFMVYLVATGGWDRVTAIWDRTKYDAEDK